MIAVNAIYISPVKSLGLTQFETVQVDSGGIIEDRRFHLINRDGALLTQRQAGSLVQIKASYHVEHETLSLRFPGGEDLTGGISLGEPVPTTIWGRQVAGRLVEGLWAAALSDFCGQQVRLVKSDLPCQCYDEYPVSLVSQASIDLLGQMTGDAAIVECKRFRPNFLISGCAPHQEDSWLGGVIRIGPKLAIQVIARDPRCAITTHDPESGEWDSDTLRHILSYRPGSRVPYFGVYGIVVSPGPVSIGDQVITSTAS